MADLARQCDALALLSEGVIAFDIGGRAASAAEAESAHAAQAAAVAAAEAALAATGSKIGKMHERIRVRQAVLQCVKGRGEGDRAGAGAPG